MDYIPAGATDQSILFHLSEGGLTITDFKLSYIRYDRGDGTSFAVGGPTALTALASITTAHTDNYGIYMGSDSSGGEYRTIRVDFPDAAFAAGKEEVICTIFSDSDDVIAQRIFRLDRQPVNAEQIEGSDATDQIRDAVVDDATRIDASALNTLSGHDPGATIGTADPGDEMNLADDAITSAKFDESTAFPIKADDSGSTYIARTGADGDTLETISDQLDAVETDTQDLQTQIGTAGAGLTDLGGMSTGMKAEVQTECDDALDAYDGGNGVAATGADGDTLETLSDQIDALPSSSAIADDVWDEALSGHTSGGSTGEAQNRLDDIQDDTEDLQTQIGTAGDGLTDVPWNASWDAEVQSECNDALVAQKLDHLVAVADSDDVVNDSIIAKLAASDGDWSGYDKTTDSLEAIRDRGDVAWISSAGGIIKGEDYDNFSFTMVDAVDKITPKTGKTVTASISKDGAAYTALTNSVTEIGSSGTYKVNISGVGDLNIDKGILGFTADGCVARYYHFRTEAG